MEHQGDLLIDRITDLPSNITDNIFMCLPLRDIVRTSALSKYWRFKWVTVPQLIFEENTAKSYEWRSPEKRAKYNANVVYESLVLHEGPLCKFYLNMTGWQIGSNISRIIHFLSKNGIQDLTLQTRDREYSQLTSSIFSCVELKHLSLTGCVFHPLTLERFNKLVSVELLHITLDPQVSITCGPLLECLKLVTNSVIDYLSIDASSLKSFVFNGYIFKACYIDAPLLEVLSLTDGGTDILSRDSELDLIPLLQSLPLLENLHLSSKFRKLLQKNVVFHKLIAKRESPNELWIVLNNLKMLELDELNLAVDEHPTMLWLMTSVPNLQKLKIELCQELKVEPLEVKDIADYSLLNLREVEVKLKCDWSKPKLHIGFLEFLLAISPVLETLSIKTPANYFGLSSYQVLSDLASFRRASATAKIVFLGPDWLK